MSRTAEIATQVHTDSTAPDGLRLDPEFEEPYYLLVARLRVQERVEFEGFVLCHGDLLTSWTLAEDLAKLPRTLAATSDRSRVYAIAARLAPRCAGWAAVRAVAWYGQHRTHRQ
ncbi:hypothetical protein [Paractinoplanes toevensis]|uniref:Uncharacterized protein n=1 Tax=Paractinoplanes toevensis TaxID=571911 RepID=A0A919W330_9ACTN|nr:hypothetical protein [Actinoplanes toevensis]GIM90110.1 hypothetical protein Ato02nite_019030 [Actinoplanes toevensis]